MQVRYRRDFQGISVATEWDPIAIMLGRWWLNPIPYIRQSGLPFRVTDADWLVVLEKTECTVESPILGLGLGLGLVELGVRARVRVRVRRSLRV